MKEKYYDMAYTEARNNARDLLNALRSDQIFYNFFLILWNY